MEITGTQTLSMSPQDVWAALNDPEVLRRCVPGCESVERNGDDSFKLVLVSSIGPLRARFSGALRMTDIQPSRSCVLLFEGQGGAIGFGKGRADVRLQDKQGQTELHYTAKAQVGGKLAQVGSRLIDSVARKMSDDFFTAFREQATPAASAPAAAAASSATVDAEATRLASPTWAWWLVAAGLAVVFALVLR